MTKTPLAIQETTALVDQFIQLSEEGAKFILTSRGQKIWAQLEAIAKELIRRGDQQYLLELTTDTRVPVKYGAAVLCRDIAPELTRQALTDLTKQTTDRWHQRRANEMLALIFPDQFELAMRDVKKLIKEMEAELPGFAAFMKVLRGESKTFGPEFGPEFGSEDDAQGRDTSPHEGLGESENDP